MLEAERPVFANLNCPKRHVQRIGMTSLKVPAKSALVTLRPPKPTKLSQAGFFPVARWYRQVLPTVCMSLSTASLSFLKSSGVNQ